MKYGIEVDLSGKIAVVTGARQGLGKVFAEALSSSGATVYLMARNEKALDEAAKEIEGRTGNPCKWFPIDVLDEASVAAAAQHIREDAGRLDILINNAAVGRGSTPLYETSLEEWNQTIATNLTGTFLAMKHFGKIMIEQKSGHIINMTSLTERAVFKDACTGAYDCSKAGIHCLTKCMAGEWAEFNVRVNSISPGLFLTDINKQFCEENPEFYDTVNGYIPLKRWGDPEEIGGLALFLLSPAADYITGADYNIDGGYTLW